MNNCVICSSRPDVVDLIGGGDRDLDLETGGVQEPVELDNRDPLATGHHHVEDAEDIPQPKGDTEGTN